MRDAASGLTAALERAVTSLAEAVAGAHPGWLLLGVLLHVANQLARGRGWYAIVGSACGADPRFGQRDAVATWVAGAGAGGVLSARGGDAVRVLMASRRLRGTPCPVLAGTLVAEGAGEALTGLALVAFAVAVGIGPAPGLPDSSALPWLAAAVALAAVGGTAVWRSARGRRVAAGVGRGCALLGAPRAYVRAVLPWQLASRGLRAAALLCFLVAFGLPATPAAVLLVMLAQGGGRLLPFAPASVGAAAAVLAAAFPVVTGTAVPAAQVAAFMIGMSTVLTVTGVLLTTAVVLRGADPRGLLAAAVAAARPQRARRGVAGA
jgi:uncharacterized membrane protein YbhN (UPF0104 family)